MGSHSRINGFLEYIDQTNKHNGGNSAKIAIAVNAWNGEEADEQLTIVRQSGSSSSIGCRLCCIYLFVCLSVTRVF